MGLLPGVVHYVAMPDENQIGKRQRRGECPFVLCLIFARRKGRDIRGRRVSETIWRRSNTGTRARSRPFLNVYSSNVVVIIVSNCHRRRRGRTPGNSLFTWSILDVERERSAGISSDSSKFTAIFRVESRTFRGFLGFYNLSGIDASPTIEVVAYEMSKPESFSFMERSLL